jgi:hypothetical protein
MSASARAATSASTTASRQFYLELFGFGVLDVVGFVDSLLLDAYLVEGIRDRTGAVCVGGGLGGMIEVILCIYNAIEEGGLMNNKYKLLSVPVSLFLLFLWRLFLCLLIGLFLL